VVYLKRPLRTLIISCVLFLQIHSPAELSAEESNFEGKMIKEVRVQSATGITPEVMQRMTALEPNQPYSSKAIRESLDLLYGTGLFSDIQVHAELENDRIVVRYVFTEKTFLSRLTIRGSLAFFDGEIIEATAMQIGDEFSQEYLNTAITKLMDFYKRHGYFQIKVKPDIQPGKAPNEAHVVLKIKEGIRARIKETKITGSKPVSENRLFKRLYSFLWPPIRSLPGEFYNSDQVDAHINRLQDRYQSNGFIKAVIGPSEVGYLPSSNEVILTIPIQSENRLEIYFEGNTSFNSSDLKDPTLFREEQSYHETVFEASAERIRRYYQSKGHPFAEVKWTREEKLAENSVIATFVIDEGPLACLESVRVQGNRFFSDRALRKILSTRRGFNPFRCSIIVPDTLTEDLNRVESLYRQEGFLEARVEAVFSYPADVKEMKRTGVSLVLSIHEGPETQVQEVLITGNEFIKTSEIMHTLNLQSGLPYNRDRVDAKTQELRRFYNLKGFIYSKINLEPKFSEDRSRVTLNYIIDEDQMAHIGRIFVEGNTFTQPYVIEREFRTQTGDPYNQEKILLTRHQVSQLRFLEGIRFHPIHPLGVEPEESIKDMRLSVRERPPKAIEIGAGYGDFDRIRGFMELSHVNLGGTGRTVRLRGEASQRGEWKTALTYLEPWFLSLPIDGRLTGQIQNQDQVSYDLTSLSISAGLEKDLTDFLKGAFVYQIEFDNFTNVPEEILKEEDQGRVNLATLNPSLIFDSRNNPFNPRAGTLSGIAFRLGAKSLGSEVQLRKATVYSSWFFPVNPWTVFAFSTQGSFGDKFGDSEEVPPSERFFVGGRSTVRGYKQDELGVVGNTIVVDGDNPSRVEFTGGNITLVGNIELRFGLPAGLGLVFFYDMGNVWADFGDFAYSDLKSTVGTGLRYNTPVGPLRLDLGYKLDREDNLCQDTAVTQCTETVEESQIEVHFTLGHSF